MQKIQIRIVYAIGSLMIKVLYSNHENSKMSNQWALVFRTLKCRKLEFETWKIEIYNLPANADEYRKTLKGSDSVSFYAGAKVFAFREVKCYNAAEVARV